jgi:hypothetical protein
MSPRPFVLLFCLICSSSAQDNTVWKDGFHPWVEPAIGISEGYSIGFSPDVGFDWQRPQFLLSASAGYGFMRKNHDNDQVPNEKGHTRSLGMDLFWRRGNNFLGSGASWGETAVTPYRKYSWAPDVAAGHNWRYIRAEVAYFRDRREYTDYPGYNAYTPGPGQPQYSNYCICSNGVTGWNFDEWYAPGETAHFLYHFSATIYRYHTTVTDPYSGALTQEQESQVGTAGAVGFGVVIRK